MPRRAPRNTRGARGILTPDLANAIVTLVAAGNYISTAARTHGIAERTLYEWIAKGEEATQAIARGETLHPRAHLYRQFAQDLANARARAEVHAVEVVEQVMAGGTLIEETPIIAKDGSIARDDNGEILYHRKYQPPDGKLALQYLGVAFPARWRPNTQRVELTGADGAPVQIQDAGDRATTLAEQLQAHVMRRQAELEAGEPADVVEGEIVDGD